MFRLITINALIFIVAIVIIEVTLKIKSPYYLKGYQLQISPHDKLYGWGYFPNQSFLLLNPDNGSISKQKVNNKGWRDKNRNFKNKKNAYRILILGDSETFGAIVKDENRYAAILESKLSQNYNIEVISIGLGGWGTDQQLEFMLNEGFKYKPNLVINQFNINDIDDNAYYFKRQKPDGCNHKLTPQFGYKAFYYWLDSTCNLHRAKDEVFFNSADMSHQPLYKKIIFSSEILKRLYAIHLRKHFNFQSEMKNYNPNKIRYKITTPRLQHLEVVLSIDTSNQLISQLKHFPGDFVPLDNLENIIDQSEFAENKDIILQILEDKHFKNNWTLDKYLPVPIDTSNYKWQLYIKLTEKLNSVVNKNGAELAIISSSEESFYDWQLSWFWMKENEYSKAFSLQHLEVLKDLTSEVNIDFIENTKPYVRAKKDPHLNEQGNAMFANDIYQYLINNRSEELEKYKIH